MIILVCNKTFHIVKQKIKVHNSFEIGNFLLKNSNLLRNLLIARIHCKSVVVMLNMLNESIGICYFGVGRKKTPPQNISIVCFSHSIRLDTFR